MTISFLGVRSCSPRLYLSFLMILLSLFAKAQPANAEGTGSLPQRIGYTELCTSQPGGRHDNVRTMRARVIKMDGSGRQSLAEELVDDPNSWTQFAGWSPDGSQAIITRGWQDPENALWEEQNKQFRMSPGKWQLDSYLVDFPDGNIVNVTGVERVSHYNGGLFFMPDGKHLGFTPLIDDVSKPYIMELDGSSKRDVSGANSGFAYGYSASPDGMFISYHENYQIMLARADGSGKKQVVTGNPFNFAPRWSPDGDWLLFVSGVHGQCDPYIVRGDGTGLRKLADLGGYEGWILFLDVEDFHQGSSDLPVWSSDGTSVFYTAKSGENVEIFEINLNDRSKQLTKSSPGTLHYHLTPSPDGKWLLYGSKSNGVRQLYVMELATGTETQITHMEVGHAAMWPHWQPLASSNP